MGQIYSKVNGVWNLVIDSSELDTEKEDPATYIVTDVEPTGIILSTINTSNLLRSYYYNGRVYWIVISSGCKIYSWDPLTKTVSLEASDGRRWSTIGTSTALPGSVAWERSPIDGIINIMYGYYGGGGGGSTVMAGAAATTFDFETMTFGDGSIATVAVGAVGDVGVTTGSFNGHGSNSGYNLIRMFDWNSFTYAGTNFTPTLPRGWGTDPFDSNGVSGNGLRSLVNMNTEINNPPNAGTPGTEFPIIYLNNINNIRFGANRWWRDVRGKRGLFASVFGASFIVGHNQPPIQLEHMTFPVDEVPPIKPIDANDVFFFYDIDKFYIMRRSEELLITCKIQN